MDVAFNVSLVMIDFDVGNCLLVCERSCLSGKFCRESYKFGMVLVSYIDVTKFLQGGCLVH